MDILRRNLMSWMAIMAMNPTLSWASGFSDKYLVLVELKGANDGINTLAPFETDNYQKFRTNLHLKKEQIIEGNPRQLLRNWIFFLRNRVSGLASPFILF